MKYLRILKETVIASISIGAFVCILVKVPNVVSAQGGLPITEDYSLGEPTTSGCGEGISLPYTALYGTEQGQYGVYVKLGVSGQTARVNLYQQQFTAGSGCSFIGSLDAVSTEWRKVGIWNSEGVSSPTTFSLSSSELQGLPDANRPTVMLVDEANPVCDPKKECYVKINNERGIVKAAGTLLNEDTLHLVKVTDPKKDTIKSVAYFVDNRPAYSKDSLEPFNMNYVSSGKHELSRIVTYESKQQIILTEAVDVSFQNGIKNYIYSIIFGRATLLITITAIVSFVLVVTGLFSIAHAIHRRRAWKQGHINTDAQSAKERRSLFDKVFRRKAEVAHIYKSPNRVIQFVKSSIPYLILAMSILFSVIFVNQYVVQFYTTDGESMRTTLENGDMIFVNKLPKTWSSISRKNYVPKRGQVIIAKKQTSILAQADVPGFGEQYLVKRVVGLPGDRVIIKAGVMSVVTRQGDMVYPDIGVGWAGNIQKPLAESIDVTLSSDELFIVGDNRPGSIDSRAHGPIKLDDVVGKVVLDLSPITKARRL